ncbi:GntR family transcriptional regulator [Sinomonas sp. RB5]
MAGTEQPHAAAERAHAALADAIVSGALAPGALITEGEQSAVLGMGRTPVREAFLRLSSEGLLRLCPKKGAVVTGEDDAAIRQLLEARVMLESESVRAVADGPRRDAAGTQELARLLEDQQRAVDARDPLAFARADHAFHAAVAAASGNALTGAFYGQISPRLERLAHAIVRQGEGNLPRFLSDHRRLITFLDRGDAAAYAVLLRTHVGLGAPRPSGS